MPYSKTKKLDEMKPKQIVEELNKYIIGQDKAKRTIAVAIRNRTRRKRLPDNIRDEVSPKNIIMIGPTGVGKTEIARRIAKLSNAPFIKVEATKYTEVGYVGRDVESIIRDLMGIAVQQVKTELAEAQADKVASRVEERLLDLLLPSMGKEPEVPNTKDITPEGTPYTDSKQITREKFRKMLQEGKFDDKEVEINVQSKKKIGIEVLGQANMEDLQDAMQSLGSIFGGGKGQARKLTIKRAREIFTEEETDKAVDTDRAVDEAKERVEQMGIVFIDEIDKVAKTGGSSSGGPDVSREGVQRDILPIVEGTSV
ncbi:MAG: HslU--HslV peptidase ATPase subunit, partial [Spirochaetia bacterium]|nr:HslU--HslV peptidase ATPase subunit [Spirochaetia bacterium]